MSVAPRALLVVVALVAAYASATGTVFQFDDAHTVAGNPAVQSWTAWAASLPGIRALTKASFVASGAFAAPPLGHVLASVALHAAAACTLLALLLRWLPSLAPRDARPAFAATAAALAFALHPAQTEAVTYVSGRSVVLAGTLYLLALLAWERHRDRGSRAARIASLAAFALALAARETAWTLPVALVLIEVARGARCRDALRTAGAHFALLAAAALAVAASPTYRWLLRESLATRGPLDNLYAQVEGIAYLVTHPLLTLRVNFDPDVVVPPSPDAGWWLAAAALALALAAGFGSLRRAPWLGVGVLWTLLHLVSTNGPVARYDLVNDRQWYLALAGPALVAGVLLARVPHAWVRTALAAGLCAGLGFATFARNIDYGSELALWHATVRASPAKSRAWNNYGWALQREGDVAAARQAYERALALDPGNFRARANRAALER